MSGTEEFAGENAVDMSLTGKVQLSSEDSSIGIPEELTDKNDFQYKKPSEDRFNQTLGMTFEKFSDYKRNNNMSPSQGGTQKISQNDTIQYSNNKLNTTLKQRTQVIPSGSLKELISNRPKANPNNGSFIFSDLPLSTM